MTHDTCKRLGFVSVAILLLFVSVPMCIKLTVPPPLHIRREHYRDDGGARLTRRSLRLANGRVASPIQFSLPPRGAAQSHEEISIQSHPASHQPSHKDENIKISIENTNTCTDSLVTALDDETLLISDSLLGDGIMNSANAKCSSGKVHFGISTGAAADDVSLYGTPKEEPGPTPVAASIGLGEPGKQSFLKNQLQALFQPTDNKLAMKLFGSKKALMKERIRQKAAGHWVIHPCSSFR